MSQSKNDIDALDSQLPENWAASTFGDIYELVYGKGLTKKERNPSGRYPVYGSNGIVDRHDDFLVEGPVIIVGRKGAAGAVSLSAENCWPIDTTYYIRDSRFIDLTFSFYLLRSLRLAQFERSTAIPGLSRDDAYPLPVKIPPSNEQRRIVAKIEELFSELDKGVESLKTAREQLKVYRQAVLKHAFEGKLTEQWREKNKHKLRPGGSIRSEILKRRRAEWEREEFQKLQEKGTIPKNDHWKQRYNEPFKFEAEELPELPRTWCWVSLDELVSGRPRSMQSGPFGSNLKHEEFRQEGILVLGIDNVLEGKFSMGTQNRISQAKFAELTKYEARPGDLLITVMASLGRTCVVPRDLETAIITKHVYRVSMEQDLLFPEFYNLLLQTETVSRQRMFKSAQGQTRPGLNSTILRPLPVPLCSLQEQQELVIRLSEDLSRIERFERIIDEQLQRSTSLRQSILKRAFSGQLVEQDPNDEPASLLLDRIKADKAEQTIGNKKNKRKEAA